MNKDDNKPRRAAPKGVRLPKELEAELALVLALTGQPFNAFVVEAITEKLGRRARRRPEDKRRAALGVSITARLADHHHELSLLCDPRVALILEELGDDLAQLRAVLMQDMERLP
jgi:hypothetical protein